MRQGNRKEKEFSTIILAAGKSERLGFPKLSLKYDDDTTFVEHIVNEYQSFGCSDIILVVNETSAKYINDSSIQLPDIVDIAINNHPDWHRFYSLKIGAKSLSKIRPTFVHNVDNPFVNKKVFKKLGDRINEADYLCPEFDGRGGHPFLISEKVINDITNVEEDQKHLKEFLNHYKRLKITVNDEKVLANINNLEEYSKYF